MIVVCRAYRCTIDLIDVTFANSRRRILLIGAGRVRGSCQDCVLVIQTTDRIYRISPLRPRRWMGIVEIPHDTPRIHGHARHPSVCISLSDGSTQESIPIPRMMVGGLVRVNRTKSREVDGIAILYSILDKGVHVSCSRCFPCRGKQLRMIRRVGLRGPCTEHIIQVIVWQFYQKSKSLFHQSARGSHTQTSQKESTPQHTVIDELFQV